MNTDDLLKQYLTTDKQHFRKMRKENPIKLSDFYNVLKWYLKLNSCSSLTVGNVDKTYKQIGWVYVKDENNIFRINGDTKLSGLKVFYANRNIPLAIIPNTRTKKLNKVTNNPNKFPVEGLYMYKD